MLYKIKDWYYDIKWSIINYFKYFKIVSKMRPWDFQYTLMMLKFQLEVLCKNVDTYSLEIEEDKTPRVEKMKRAIELLNNFLEDNYEERSGYIADATKMEFEKIEGQDFYRLKIEAQPGYEDYDRDEVYKKSRKLKEEEWKELFELLENNIEGWWS